MPVGTSSEAGNSSTKNWHSLNSAIIQNFVTTLLWLLRASDLASSFLVRKGIKRSPFSHFTQFVTLQHKLHAPEVTPARLNKLSDMLPCYPEVTPKGPESVTYS